MDKKLESEIRQVNRDLFAYPKCHIRESTAAELGISEQAREALLRMHTLPIDTGDDLAIQQAAFLCDNEEENE